MKCLEIIFWILFKEWKTLNLPQTGATTLDRLYLSQKVNFIILFK